MGNDRELLMKLIEQMGAANSRLDAIDKNLAEHMRRTSMVEGRADRFERFMYMTHGVVAFLLSMSAVVAVGRYFMTLAK